MFAIVRPDAWNLPLFVHVLGAVLLVGTLVVVLAVSAGAARGGESVAVLSRLSFRALLIGVLPSYIVMRAGAEWVASEEAVGDPTWVGIGYMTSDVGLLLTLIAIGLAWRASRRGTSARAVTVLAAVLLLAFAVAIWAMTTKPD
jgi:4-amino-4-deoxy-L-arabinose transferase-like glycosyltransferase